MKLAISIGAIAWMLLAGCAVQAQSPVLGGSRFDPPLPPPPPPPKMDVPKVPQLDAPPRYNYQPQPQPSFGARISRCLDEAAGAGLRGSAREFYSRNCANR
jgi:hypothetical protein